jgi:uncharacterized protein (DUF488 family)
MILLHNGKCRKSDASAMTTISRDPHQHDVTTTEIMTIGHSTRPLGEFINILQSHSVTLLIDIRTVPRSRHNPQYNKESLPESLAAAGIGYEHFAGLGGLRRPRPDSTNTGWRNAGFRGYADYMQTPEFDSNVEKLIGRARTQRLVVMCAEALPWRCHRSLLADALIVRGVKVAHIMSETNAKEHTLIPWATLSGTRITYPPDTLPLNLESG